MLNKYGLTMTSSVSSVILINVPFLGYLFVVDCYILPYAQTCLEWIGKYDTPICNSSFLISLFLLRPDAFVPSGQCFVATRLTRLLCCGLLASLPSFTSGTIQKPYFGSSSSSFAWQGHHHGERSIWASLLGIFLSLF